MPPGAHMEVLRAGWQMGMEKADPLLAGWLMQSGIVKAEQLVGIVQIDGRIAWQTALPVCLRESA